MFTAASSFACPLKKPRLLNASHFPTGGAELVAFNPLSCNLSALRAGRFFTSAHDPFPMKGEGRSAISVEWNSQTDAGSIRRRAAGLMALVLLAARRKLFEQKNTRTSYAEPEQSHVDGESHARS
jgi:hypothetical protein